MPRSPHSPLLGKWTADIGGSASNLHHSAGTGVTDGILLERNRLISGTTWHSAAQGVRAVHALTMPPAVLTQVPGTVYRAISTFLIRRAGLRVVAGARTSAVTPIERFGSAPNLSLKTEGFQTAARRRA